MYKAARPYATAGVALVGASVIAVTPIAAPRPELQVPNPPVQLAALVNPIEVFGPIFGQAVENAGVLGEQVLANPAPILTQILANQISGGTTLAGALQTFVNNFGEVLALAPEQINTATRQLAAGDITGALSTISQIVFDVIGPSLGNLAVLGDVIDVVGQPGRNLLNVIAAVPDLVRATGRPTVNAVQNIQLAVGRGVEDLIAAVGAGDPEAFANAIINGSAGLTRAVLQAVLDPDIAPLDVGGLLSGLLQARDVIAGAVTPHPQAPISAPPTSGTTTMTLPTPPVAEKVDAPTPRATATPPARIDGETAHDGIGSHDATAERDATSEDDAADGTSKAVVDLTKGNKVEPAKTGTTVRRPGQGVRAAVEGVGDTFRKVTDGFKRAVDSISGRRNTGSGEGAGSRSAGKTAQ
ncbi:MAG: hypothetical protein ACRDU5_07105 [Mycobacterium sp.]